MRRIALAFLPLVAPALAAVTADAAEIGISLPSAVTVERQTVRYTCGEAGALDVEYINAGSVSLAVFTHEDQPVVAANVISASGARYAGGHLVWWTQGPEAMLYDITEGEDAPPVAECREAA